MREHTYYVWMELVSLMYLVDKLQLLYREWMNCIKLKSSFFYLTFTLDLSEIS